MTEWHCRETVFSLERPLVVGVVNVTPDSFSDGGQYGNADEAVAQGLRLVAEGADLVDIGGESSRPGAAPVPAEEEKRRILPVIRRLSEEGVVVSVDTAKPEVMRAAVDNGAQVINDINGFRHPQAPAVAAASGCGLIVMHMRGQPQNMQDNPEYDDVIATVADFFSERLSALCAAGIDESRLCLDPGVGFGKTREHNLALLANLPALAIRGRPLLIGVSRKSLFTEETRDRPLADRDVISAAAAALLAQRGGQLFRVHNARMTVDALAAARLLAT